MYQVYQRYTGVPAWGPDSGLLTPYHYEKEEGEFEVLVLEDRGPALFVCWAAAAGVPRARRGGGLAGWGLLLIGLASVGRRPARSFAD